MNKIKKRVNNQTNNLQLRIMILSNNNNNNNNKKASQDYTEYLTIK